MDPTTLLISTGLQILPGVLTSILGHGGPSAAELAAQRAREAAAARQRVWLIGGALVVGALVVGVIVSRR
jgi:hypothetical protein